MNNNYEFEALKIFAGKGEQFPMICQCIRENAPNLQAVIGKNESENSEPDLEVIWAGSKDKDSNQVICQLTAPGVGVAKSYYVKVVDKQGNTITEKAFVSFSHSTAYAVLTVPKLQFAECSVQMSAASVGRDSCAAGTSEVVPLAPFDTEDLEIKEEIKAPKFTRERHGDNIEISYYSGSSSNPKDFDYIYSSNLNNNQLYFPTSGNFEITGVQLDSNDSIMELTITDGIKDAVHPDDKDVTFTVSNSRIEYKVEDKWRNKKLRECFDVNAFNYYGYITYTLSIQVVRKKDSTIISILVTNADEIVENVDKVFKIPKIHVYYDCFAEGTKIGMADGTTKIIENIKKGDAVRTKTGEAARVTEISALEECHVLNLIMRSGRELAVTGGHAVYTKDGVYPASRLKAGMEVLTENSVDVLDEIIPSCEGGFKVYSLILEGEDKCMFANGVVVHDSDSKDLFKDRDWVREGLPQEWLMDYDNALKAGIVYGRR